LKRSIPSAASRASRKLNLAQPAISHALGRLRQLVGDPLFGGQGQAMISTPVAYNLIEPIRRSLRGLHTFAPQTATKQFKTAGSGNR